MKELTAILERDSGNWWNATMPDVPGCHTQGRTIEQAMRRMAEALELFDVNPNRVRLVEDVRLPAKAKNALKQTIAARERAEAEMRRAQASTLDAVRLLEDLGVSLRDAGRLLGLSRQRVQQLLHLED